MDKREGKQLLETISASQRARIRKRYPSITDLNLAAARRIPRFMYDFLDSGVGPEMGVARNRRAFESIEVIPRYGLDPADVRTEIELFGHRYAAPVGISPVGMDGLIWPGATMHLARAAQHYNIPYIAGALASAPIEQVAQAAPDVTWFQLYPIARDDYAINRDLIRRADTAGVKVLILTLDIPVKAKRDRDIKNGLSFPFRPRVGTVLDILSKPAWLRALASHGHIPTFANMIRYAGENAKGNDAIRFVQQQSGGGFTWETVAKLREAWPRALVVKGILHPGDAERAIAAGADGIMVSNHGARQFDAAPASIDMVSAIAEAVGDRATVMLDSGIRSGLDVYKALGRGAQAAFCGRAFLYGLGAMGGAGAGYVAELLIEELRTALGQSGTLTPQNTPYAALSGPANGGFPSFSKHIADNASMTNQ